MLPSGYISHYESYKYIDYNRYHKTIVAPSRNRSWRLDEVIPDSHICATLCEDACEPTLIEDVAKYVMECIPFTKSIDIYLSYDIAHDHSLWREYNELIDYYREKKNLYKCNSIRWTMLSSF